MTFSSYASNLVAGDANAQPDVFVHDRQTGTTVRISVATDGTEANGTSFRPAISADGRFVAFGSSATNLVAESDTNGQYDIFVRDLQTGTTIRVSEATDGILGDGESYGPSMSADGRFVSFYSYSTNLVAGDTNGVSDIFVHDTLSGSTARASLSSAGAEGNGYSSNASLSEDGRWVAFDSLASNLVTGDTNGIRDVFAHDMQTGETRRVSVSSSGAQATGRQSYGEDSRAASISSDGRFVAFLSYAANLVPDDTNDWKDVFVYDLLTGACTRVSLDSDGNAGNAYSGSDLCISGDGHSVVFTSRAGNLVSSDTNGRPDLFVATREWMTRVHSVSPTLVSTTGVTPVVVTGWDFNKVTSVTFGGVPATGFVVQSPTRIAVNAPANVAGDALVEVTGAYGTSPEVVGAHVNYVAPPAISGLSVDEGPVTGGTVVVISGTGFVNASGASAVTFGDKNATSYTVDSDTQITATAPDHSAGTVRVKVTVLEAPSPDTSADDFAFQAASITSLSATSGPDTGGTTVIITGTGFLQMSGEAAVTFGGKSARSYTVDSATQITAVSPSHVAGPVRIALNTGGYPSEDGEFDEFEYYAVDARMVERASGDETGLEGDLDSTHVSLSADGRYVAFDSEASNLVPGDTNDCSDVFVYDRQTGAYRRVSVSSTGVQGAAESVWGSISADGSCVAFMSRSTNLASGGSGDDWDVFVHDLDTGATEWVDNFDPMGLHENYYPSLSADGQRVCYTGFWRSGCLDTK